MIGFLFGCAVGLAVGCVFGALAAAIFEVRMERDVDRILKILKSPQPSWPDVEEYITVPDLCWCCGDLAPTEAVKDWDGRLDGYCLECALYRCDAYIGQCGKKIRYA